MILITKITIGGVILKICIDYVNYKKINVNA